MFPVLQYLQNKLKNHLIKRYFTECQKTVVENCQALWSTWFFPSLYESNSDVIYNSQKITIIRNTYTLLAEDEGDTKK